MRKSLFFVMAQDAEGNTARGVVDVHYGMEPPPDTDHPGALIVRVDATVVEAN
jgi:hypothetical protein